MAGGFSACKEEPKEEPKEPKDTSSLVNTKWKLIGIVDVETDSLTEPEPKPNDYDKFYTLTFDTDSTFSGQATNNRIIPFHSKYEIDYVTRTLLFTAIVTTEAMDLGDGELYRKILKKIQSFTINNVHPRQLHLYYDDSKKYLKYNEVGG